jgi:hypothetical protein
LKWTGTPWPGQWLTDVLWDGDAWLAVGHGEEIWRSSDGTTWHITGQIDDAYRIARIISNGTGYLAATNQGVFTSPDGAEWERTLPESPGDITVADLIRADGKVIAVGTWPGSHGFIAVSSDDGLSWETTFWDGLRPSHIVWTGSTFIVWDGRPSVLTSSDTQQWILTDLDPQLTFSDLMVVNDIALGLNENSGLSWVFPNNQTIVVPAVADLESNGNQRWRSDLLVLNTWFEDVPCRIEFLRRDQANLDPESVAITLDARATITLRDVLPTIFETSGVGALRLRPESDRVDAAGRINGNGVARPSQLLQGAASTDQIWWFERGFLLGLSSRGTDDEGTRTNIGVVNNCPTPISVSVNVFTPEGEVVGHRTMDLQPFEVRQWNRVFRSLGTNDIEGGFAELKTTATGCGFFAYASVIDNEPGDPATVNIQHVPRADTQP